MPRRNSDNTQAWSASRSTLLATCRRAFYLEVTARADAHKAAHQIPLRTVVGSAVHAAIADQMARWGAREPISRADAEASARTFISDIWRVKEMRITECLNGIELADERHQEMQSAARHQLRNFFRMIWPQFSDHSYVEHEYRDNFLLNGASVSVQIDLATRDPDNNFVISDWKTGWLGHREPEAFQMSVYELWAHLRYHISVSKIRTLVVNLRTGQIVRGTPSEDLLAETSERIRSESLQLGQLHKPAAFPTSPELQKCIACRYMGQCPDGKRAVALQRAFVAQSESA